MHGYVAHKWSSDGPSELFLQARARQFSSFILMVGRITGPNEFDPKHAILIQNKDDLSIPLMLEALPTPKEFRDSISSLSPEQQRFAKAFRSMQLESTLFGVVIIQIKPLVCIYSWAILLFLTRPIVFLAGEGFEPAQPEPGQGDCADSRAHGALWDLQPLS